MKTIFILSIPNFNLFYVLFCSLQSLLDINLFIVLFTSVIIIGGLSHIKFSGNLVNSVKTAGKILITGAIAKAGSDLYDAARDYSKEKVGEYNKDKTTKNGGSSENKDNTENKK